MVRVVRQSARDKPDPADALARFRSGFTIRAQAQPMSTPRCDPGSAGSFIRVSPVLKDS